jgi:RNA polymerase sigma factor (sigma-70 family)
MHANQEGGYMPDANDAEDLVPLLAATARQDQHAFHQLYLRTSGRVFGICLRLLEHRDQAEDVLQETFIRVWHNATEYHEERGTPITWMLTIARYQALDLLRKNGRRQSSDITRDEADDQGPLFQTEQMDSLARLGDCLQDLSEEQRDSVVMAYYRGLTHEELSENFRAPLGTVKSWVRRGLQYLRRCLQS